MGARLLELGVIACLIWVAVPAARRGIAAPAVALGAVTAAMFGLVVQLLEVDTGNRYVARTTSSTTPAPFRVAALWGGMEGSFLLWSWMILVVGLWGSRRARPQDRSIVAGVVAVAAAAHLAILRLTASPFVREPVPPGDGVGLTAVLQDHAMLIHPPLLYLGTVTLLPAFAITVASCLGQRLDGCWLAELRRWLWGGWIVLGVGMVLGANWAYRELGWGGWWAWDPVENGALLPWLLMTAALHTTGPAARAGRFRSTSATLVVIAAVVATAAVYVTRSGSLGSIHAFAQSDSTGWGLLAVTAATTVTGIWALRRITSSGAAFTGTGRLAIAAHVAVVGAAVLVIGLGTFAPAAISIVDGGGPRAITAASYYASLVTPIAAVGLVVMAAGPYVRRGVPAHQLAAGAIGGAGLGVVLALASGVTHGWAPLLIVLAASSGAVTLAGAWSASGARTWDRRWRAALAHVGVALVAVGAAGAASGTDTTLGLEVGESRVIDAGRGTVLRLDALDRVAGRRFDALRATLTYAGHPVTTELRTYPDQRLPTAEAGFVGAGLGEVTVVMGSVTSDLARARFEVHVRPLIGFVWVGATLMLASALPFRLGPIVRGLTRRRREPAVDHASGRPATTRAGRPS